MASSSTSADVLVPFAHDAAGRWISPEGAHKGEQYSCPECRAVVVIREPTDRIRHFAHRRKPDSCPLVRGNERLRRRALTVVRAVVERSLVGQDDPPVLEYSCLRCHTVLGPVGLPRETVGVRTSVALPGCLVRADAAFVDRAGDVLWVVVLRLSRSPAGFRTRSLADRPWVELDAERLLTNPTQWLATRAGNLGPVAVHTCPPRRFEWRKRNRPTSSAAQSVADALRRMGEDDGKP